MRLLHAGHDHVGRRTARQEAAPRASGNCPGHGREHLPLRHLFPHSASHSPGGRRPEWRWQMSGSQWSVVSGQWSGNAVGEPAIEPERYEFFDEPRYQSSLDRRDFFKVVGGGMFVCLILGDAVAQEPAQQGRGRGFGGGGPQELGAWLHIGEDGQVTVYTGKVEVGQNIRTSLSQVVAEELRLPVAAIHLVMADTQLTPFDMGTFGSMTTPSMASNLRRI